MRRQPKKNITKVNKSQKIYGNMLKKSYQKTILEYHEDDNYCH